MTSSRKASGFRAPSVDLAAAMAWAAVTALITRPASRTASVAEAQGRIPASAAARLGLLAGSANSGSKAVMRPTPRALRSRAKKRPTSPKPIRQMWSGVDMAGSLEARRDLASGEGGLHLVGNGLALQAAGLIGIEDRPDARLEAFYRQFLAA